jgi:hypothetical protein
MRPCQNFVDFFISGNFSTTQLIFQVNSSRFVCIFATENPVVNPSGQLAKVGTRNCDGVAGSIWNVRGEETGGFRQVEKLRGIDSTNFCMRENTDTSAVELEVCQVVPRQKWKFERVSLPPER